MGRNCSQSIGFFVICLKVPRTCAFKAVLLSMRQRLPRIWAGKEGRLCRRRRAEGQCGCRSPCSGLSPTGLGNHFPDGPKADHALILKLDESGRIDHASRGAGCEIQGEEARLIFPLKFRHFCACRRRFPCWVPLACRIYVAKQTRCLGPTVSKLHSNQSYRSSKLKVSDVNAASGTFVATGQEISFHSQLRYWPPDS